MNYWDVHYKKGLGGVKGSIGEDRVGKWSIIDSILDVSEHNVIDVGCDDLSFWEGRTCRNYLGSDISPAIIEGYC